MAYVYIYNNSEEKIQCPILRNPTPVTATVDSKSLAIMSLGVNSLSSRLAHSISQRINHYYDSEDILASCSIDYSDLYCLWEHWQLEDWDHVLLPIIEKSLVSVLNNFNMKPYSPAQKVWSRAFAVRVREKIRETINHDILEEIRSSNSDGFIEDQAKRQRRNLPNLVRDEEFRYAMNAMSCFIAGSWISPKEVDLLIVRSSDSSPYILNFKIDEHRVETCVDLSKNGLITSMIQLV